MDGRESVLRYLKIILCSNFLWTCLLIISIVAAGYLNFKKITRHPFFVIKKIEFDGNERVREEFLLTTLRKCGLKYNGSILSANVNKSKERLENIPWIKSVIVQRQLPQTVVVRISERIPIAIWQFNRKLYLVDKEGKAMENDGMSDTSHLPIIAGVGAEKEAANLLFCLEKFPKIRKQLVFAIMVGTRRWDLIINKNVRVKLPEVGIIRSLKTLEELPNTDGFLKEDISVIDLRMMDRIILTRKQAIQQKDHFKGSDENA